MPIDLSAGLPAPRDDEPEMLRQDIWDELNDHLASACDQEQQRLLLAGSTDPDNVKQTAMQQVLERFGNPVHIARRLWWDAMWERVMTQRTQTTALVVVALVAIAMFFLMWQQTGANRQLIADNQKLQTALLEQLDKLANRPEPAPAAVSTAPSEWNRLKVVCRWDTDSGAPAADVRVRVVGASDNVTGIPPIDQQSNSDGQVDVGLLLYGQYQLTAETPAGLIYETLISMHPGTDSTITLACPSGLGETAIKLTGFQEPLQAILKQYENLGEQLGLPADKPLEEQIWLKMIAQDRHRTKDAKWHRAMPNEDKANWTIFYINAAGDVRISSQDVLSEQVAPITGFSRISEHAVRLPTPVSAIPVGTYGWAYSTLYISDPGDPTGERIVGISLPQVDGPSSTREAKLPTIKSALGTIPFALVGDQMPEAAAGGFTVEWRAENTIEVPPEYVQHFSTCLKYAVLAQRIPQGMSVVPIPVAELPADIKQPGVVDLAWRGLTVNDNGDVTAEEHLLQEGVELLFAAPVGQPVPDISSGDEPIGFLVATPEEANVFLDVPGTLAHIVVSQQEQPRTAAQPLDPALTDRLAIERVIEVHTVRSYMRGLSGTARVSPAWGALKTDGVKGHLHVDLYVQGTFTQERICVAHDLSLNSSKVKSPDLAEFMVLGADQPLGRVADNRADFGVTGPLQWYLAPTTRRSFEKETRTEDEIVRAVEELRQRNTPAESTPPESTPPDPAAE